MFYRKCHTLPTNKKIIRVQHWSCVGVRVSSPVTVCVRYARVPMRDRIHISQVIIIRGIALFRVGGGG